MKLLIALLVVLPTALLVLGRVLGRVQVRPCCVPAEQDARMAAAYADPADRGPAPETPPTRVPAH